MAVRSGAAQDWWADQLVEAKIVTREHSSALLDDFLDGDVVGPVATFRDYLIHHTIITPFQARRIEEGHARKLNLGLYTLTEQLGSGGLGPLYQAIGISDRRWYSIKLLPKRDSWNTRMVREQIQAFANLPPQPGVVSLIDVGTAHGYHYLVWPFATGQSLEAVVREFGPVASGELARIGRKVAECLKICHQGNLVHGLIKPSNILLGERGRIQLLDFGIGALLADNTDSGIELIDTASRAKLMARFADCAAPESIADSSKWSALGDQYSLGCSLYFAATGRYPYPGGGFLDKIIAHQKQTPTPITTLNPDVPPQLARIVERLMQKSSLQRYRRWEELVEDLAKLANRTPAPPPATVDVQTPRPHRPLTLHGTSLTPVEPQLLELPRRSTSSIWSAIGLRKPKMQELRLSVFSPGLAQPGQTIVLHAYLHEIQDTDRLRNNALKLPQPAERIALLNLPGNFSPGDWIRIRWLVEGSADAEEQQEVEWKPPLSMRRLPIHIRSSYHGEPVECELHLGTGENRQGQRFADSVEIFRLEMLNIKGIAHAQARLKSRSIGEASSKSLPGVGKPRQER